VSASGVPKIDVLLAAVIEVCQRRMEPLTAREIDSLVIDVLAILAGVVARAHGLKGSRTEVAYRLAWARSMGKSLGVLERTPDARGLLSPFRRCSSSVLASTSQLVSSHATGDSNHPWIQ
jgi:hypothetical protein